VAENQYGKAEQNLLVDVASEFKIMISFIIWIFIARPKFTQPLSNRDYTSDKPLRLNVRVEGNPVPEVKWLKVHK